MIHSKTPKDNSSDPSSLGNAADYSGPGSPLQSSADDGERISAAIPIAPAREPLLSDGPRWRYSKREAGSNRPGSVKFYRIDGPGKVELYVVHEADVDRRVEELNDALQAGFDGAVRRMEQMITSGELRVVKKGEWEMVSDRIGGMADEPAMFAHKECPAADSWGRTRVAEAGYTYKPRANFCADCGASMSLPHLCG